MRAGSPTPEVPGMNAQEDARRQARKSVSRKAARKSAAAGQLPADAARKAASASQLPADAALTEYAKSSKLMDESKRGLHRKIVFLAVVLVIVSIATLPIGASAKVFHSPAEVLDAFGYGLTLISSALLENAHYTASHINETCPQYFDVMERVAILFINILGGGMLALSGSLYQTVFRNPIAAPTMLGVGNGVTLGVVALVFLFGVDAPYHVGEHYLLCYTFAIIILAIVIGVSTAIGKGRPSVTDMLLVGSVLSGMIGQLIMFLTYFVFTDEMWEAYNGINEVLSVKTDTLSLVVLGIVFLLGVVPIVAMRFKINLVAFSEHDIRMSGSNPTLLRSVTLVCATILIIGAQVHVGTVAMVALAVPFLSRLVFGAEFGRQTWGDLFVGAIMLVICNALVGVINISLYQAGVNISVPIGLIANVVTLPLFAWIMASARRGWQ